jgi:hypothetical protein
MHEQRTFGFGVVAAALAFMLLAAVTFSVPSAKAASKSTLKKSAHVALKVPVSRSGGFNYTQGSYLEGFEFTSNRVITVTKLGAYDSNLSKLPNGTEKFMKVPVALYDITSNTLVRKTKVDASDPSKGVYRYAALSRPVTLNTTDTYAVVWVSLSDYYVASPKLVASDVNSALTYLAMAGYGPGGLTTTSAMVEPNWFYTVSANGLAAINYDLGPNFLFTTSKAAPTTTTTTTVPAAGTKVALGTNNPTTGDCTTNTSEKATAVGYVTLTVTSSAFTANIHIQSGKPNTVYDVFLQQVPGSCPQLQSNGGTLKTNSKGGATFVATVPRIVGATTFFVQLVNGEMPSEYTSDRISSVS